MDLARLLASFGRCSSSSALMVVFTVMSPNFIDPLNLFNIMRAGLDHRPASRSA